MCDMNKSSLLYLFITTLIFYACGTSKIYHPQADITPGAIPINGELLCDRAEATNFNWLEYMYWTGRTYGFTSLEYKSTIPDTSIWNSLHCDSAFVSNYLRHPSYHYYPVVGVSQRQAKDFSNWRADRVFQLVLIKEGVLEFNNHTWENEPFSIQRYFSGDYKYPFAVEDTFELRAVVPDYSRPYPQYRLPSESERLEILNYIDSTDYRFHLKKEKKYTKWRKNNVPFLLAQQPCKKDSISTTPTRPVDPLLDTKGKFGLIYNSRGNVAEWGAKEHMTYGGGWPHNVEYIMSKDTVSSNTPNAWTGFRNVCEWRLWKP